MWSPSREETKTETYEDEVKTLFVKQPANMRLLIVVDKLLTGFDVNRPGIPGGSIS